MFNNPSLVTRIGIGKAIGFIIGLAGFFMLPWFWPEAPLSLRWGVLLWYPTVGAFIGVFGVFTWHPIAKIPLPWWFRAPLIGGWMNFVLTLFAGDQMRAILASMFGPNALLTSPLWFVVEGLLVGLLIGYLATRFGGEGKALLEEMDEARS